MAQTKLSDFPNPKAFELTEDQRATLVNSLRVAASRFDTDVETCNILGHERLALQFVSQAVETRALADRIDNAEYVKIGPEDTE